ncbi:MAG: cell shape determination protein CcmA [Proteobacteria bacterium SG_bin6]|nr:MAG: cell shape determination protein CcmA [Proteobacteria bacterium SG_bin6]
MFSNNRQRDTSSLTTASGGGKRQFSVVGPDVRIIGNLSATADLHLDGTIEGDLACATLVQGTEGRVIGNVRAESARIAGTIEGGVSARNITIERAARITGDVEYETIEIENGAQVDGRLTHRGAGATTAPVLVEVLPPVVEGA